MFYADDMVTLYHGDSLAILPTLASESVDAVITDPPYSSGGMSLSARQADPATKYQQTGTKKTYPPMLGDNRDQRSFIFWATLWLSECLRIARTGSPLLVFTDWRQLPAMTDAVQAAGWMWRGIVVWHKSSARPMIGEFRRDSEFIIYGCKGKLRKQTNRCLPGVFNYSVNTAQKIHITSKPLPLLQEFMAITPPEGTVLDPFLGGGTTAVAAKLNGRKSIGIELSPEYIALAVQRIKAA